MIYDENGEAYLNPEEEKTITILKDFKHYKEAFRENPKTNAPTLLYYINQIREKPRKIKEKFSKYTDFSNKLLNQLEEECQKYN